jgi:hypothetical protein
VAEVQAIGDPGRPARAVLRAAVAAVDLVLRALPPQPVILTALASAGASEMFVTFARPPAVDLAGLGRDVAGLGGAVPEAAAWRAVLETGDGGPGCLEVRWRVVPA